MPRGAVRQRARPARQFGAHSRPFPRTEPSGCHDPLNYDSQRLCGESKIVFADMSKGKLLLGSPLLRQGVTPLQPILR